MEINSILKQLSDLSEHKLDICIHEIACLLKELEELNKRKYTSIRGYNNFLDLIKNVDVTEYSLMYCPHCRKITHITAEGCEGLILFSCDACNEIVDEMFRIMD